MQVAPASPVARLWERALDLLFPPRCVSCGRFGALICEPCRANVTPALPPRCRGCWMPANAAVCPRCHNLRPHFSAVRAPFVYGGPARDAVHALKFNGVSAVAGLMAEAMSRVLAGWSPRVDAIVPVPLSGHRRRVRGYNQSELLARHVARATGLSLRPGAVVRRRSTAAQVQQPDEESRRGNVADAFAPGPQPVSGGVLLIDDVVTTGATLDACARVLLDSGANAVYGLVFARED